MPVPYSENKRSPLKDRPLRHAGQSLDEEISRLIDEDALTVYICAALLVILAGLDWWRYHFESPPLPWLYTVVAVIGVAAAAWKIARVRRQVHNLRLGRDGERAVAQFLEDLRIQDFRVFHDLPGDGFNVDHVIVGPKGVFTIEAKTWSKPARGEAKITFDGEQVSVTGFGPDPDPVAQARAQADWLCNLISEFSGRNVSVRPMVVYPGWFIVGPLHGVKPDVWVLNPKAVPAFTAQERDVLSPEDVNLISFHLSRYIRAENA